MLWLLAGIATGACGPSATYDGDDDGDSDGEPVDGGDPEVPGEADAMRGGGGPACAGNVSETIYVVAGTGTGDDRLLRFDPASAAFELVGALDCPYAPPPPPSSPDDPPPLPVRPHSMAVAQDGTAWVRATNEQLFRVSTVDATCADSGYAFAPGNLHSYGMAFVRDPGASTEQLFLAGGAGIGLEPIWLATMDLAAFDMSVLGEVDHGLVNPELTGTGAGELYGYFPNIDVNPDPGSPLGFIARLDRATGAHLQTWPLPELDIGLKAYAIAHYGGELFVFLSYGLPSGEFRGHVVRLDPASGAFDLLEPAHDHYIVGAGVSTCVPVVVD